MFDSKLVTVWSAPNYCYRAGNVASILCFTSTTEKQAKLFDAVPDDKRVIPPVHTTPYFLWRSCTPTAKCKLCIFLDGVFILPLRMNGYVVGGSPSEANEDYFQKILLVGGLSCQPVVVGLSCLPAGVWGRTLIDKHMHLFLCSVKSELYC